MARKKRDRELLLRWIWALTGMLLLAAVLTIGLRRCPAEPATPTVPVVPQSAAPVPGIDVSHHQGDIDWQAVRDHGVEFAIIRLGYRGYDDGLLHVDEKAVENLTGAREAGLKIGAYFFSQALDADEAEEEAALALQVLDGMPLDLPLAYDWEYVSPDKRTGDMEADALTGCVHAFCDTIQAAGYQPMVYFNQELSQTLLDLDTVRSYPFWFARYAPQMDFDRKVLLWQYSDQGQIPGIREKVDLDWWYPS